MVASARQVDEGLSEELKGLLAQEYGDKRIPATEGMLDQGLYQKCTSEMYGAHVRLLKGEPKNIVNGVIDSQWGAGWA